MLSAVAMTALATGCLASACMGGGGGGSDPAPSSTSTPAGATTPAAESGASPAAAAATTTASAATVTSPAAGPGSAAPAATVAAPGSNATGVLIPLYTVPTDPSWTAVETAKKAHPTVPIVAVVNPANGPGPAADAAYTAGIDRLVAAGVKVLGYVRTAYASRAATDDQADIDSWHSFYPAVTGIFFDEQANTTGHEGYYQGLTAYAKAHGLDFTVGNPGADAAPSYVGSVDVLLIYESAGLPSLSFLGGWHAGYDRHNFGIIPYGCAAFDPAYVQEARLHVGYVYVQSDTMPNPWDSVPAYLDSLVASVQ